MDKKQVMQWIVAALARGIAFILAGWLGLEAAESESLGMGLAQGLGAVAVACVSIYTSYKGRKKLKAEFPRGD